MADEIKLSNKARNLVLEFEIATNKKDSARIAKAALAIREFAKGQKDAKVRSHLLSLVGADQGPPPRPENRSGGPRRPGPGGFRSGGHEYSGGGNQTAIRNQSKADPSVLGLPFHNPFTFIPFEPDAPPRSEAKLLTADEEEMGRLTGVIDLRLETVSPLLSADPANRSKDDHKEYKALTIGPDLIVPATGIRGALRQLVTIITSSALITLDQDSYACQGRDAQLGPKGAKSPDHVPDVCFLGRVLTPGSDGRSGRILLGQTELVSVVELAVAVAVMNGDRDSEPPEERGQRDSWAERKLRVFRPTSGRASPLWARRNEGQLEVSQHEEPGSWQARLSGRPINLKGKREALFLGDGETIELPSSYWREFNFRHQHGVRESLRKGDLVWLEPKNSHCTVIRSADDIKSLQWARWGRRGLKFADLVPPHIRPSGGHEVDVATDLFGQVAGERDDAPTFAGRIRPENLVFEDSAKSVETCTLPPLSPPHPGCAAFYRWHGKAGVVSADAVSPNDPAMKFRGYKVYRTTQERGAKAPWRWSEQPVFDDNDASKAKSPRQKVNKTVDLLPEGKRGRLRIAFRSLDSNELGLLVLACKQPWRIGGGKPLGLGHCSVEIQRILDEFGEEVPVPDLSTLPEPWLRRADWWSKTQEPVPFLRYPRAARRNNNRISRGGHIWYQLFAVPAHGEPRVGLQAFRVHGDLRQTVKEDLIAAQPLPAFDPAAPQADVLYGYDGFPSDDGENQGGRGGGPTPNSFSKFERFDPKLVRPSDRSQGNQSYGRDKRERDRRDR
jgi:hypothetical protein